MSASKPVVLVWGESEFLVREAARETLGEDGGREVDAREWEPGLTAALSTPSLFGERRGLLVWEAQRLPDEALAEIGRYAGDPSPDARLVLAVLVSPRAKGPPRGLVRALPAVVDVRRAVVERRDLPAWVSERARARGLQASPAGANALVQTLGEDPGILAQAVEQLAGSHAAEGLTTEAVAAQFRGFGDRRIWELCDAAFSGNAPLALRTLAGMLEAGEEPLAILGGIAARVRDLLRVRSAGPRVSPADVARAAGLRFEWQGRRYRDQARRFSGQDLETIHARIVEADRALKQGAAGGVVLPAVVHRIADPRGGADGTIRGQHG